MNAGAHSFQTGKLDGAVRAFIRATELLPERVEGWVNLGSALLESRQYEAAALALQRAISMNPRMMITYMILGDVWRLLGKATQSLESYQKAVSLQRTPLALNKLACALRARSRFEEAEGLYLEAERIDPKFSLARVNRASMQIERKRYQEAYRQLTAIDTRALHPAETREVIAGLGGLAERARLSDAIDAMVAHGDLATLEARLRETPLSGLQIDKASLRTVEAYANFARSEKEADTLPALALPDDWPLIEAMHMIPLVHSVDDYLAIRANSESLNRPAVEVQQSLNMEPAIREARKCRDDMGDPVKAELHLRYWHALACREVEGFSPGHFKYTQNWSAMNPTLPRVEPGMCSGTIRYVISDIYNSLPPGLLRAAVAFLGIVDPHPYADGNGRVAMIWLNRELEWAGLMPALFSEKLGVVGELGKAIVEVKKTGGNLTPFLDVIRQAQQHAQDFCTELAGAMSDAR